MILALPEPSNATLPVTSPLILIVRAVASFVAVAALPPERVDFLAYSLHASLAFRLSRNHALQRKHFVVYFDTA